MTRVTAFMTCFYTWRMQKKKKTLKVIVNKNNLAIFLDVNPVHDKTTLDAYSQIPSKSTHSMSFLTDPRRSSRSLTAKKLDLVL